MTKFEDNLSPYLTIVEATEPSAPSAGQQRLYIDSTTHLLKATNSSGTDRTIEGLANPLTTTGDIIYSSSGTTAARRAVGSTGDVLTVAGGVPTWAAPAAGGGVAMATVVGDGSGDYSTGSTSFADVNASLSITTTNAASGDKLEILLMCATDAGNSGNAGFTFNIAATDVGDTLGLMFVGASLAFRGTIIYEHTMASGTQVTIKARWKTASGTLGMYNRSAVVVPRMVVKNLTRSGTL